MNKIQEKILKLKEGNNGRNSIIIILLFILLLVVCGLVYIFLFR